MWTFSMILLISHPAPGNRNYPGHTIVEAMFLCTQTLVFRAQLIGSHQGSHPNLEQLAC